MTTRRNPFAALSFAVLATLATLVSIDTLAGGNAAAVHLGPLAQATASALAQG
jgi:hypothetical protein